MRAEASAGGAVNRAGVVMTRNAAWVPLLMGSVAAVAGARRRHLVAASAADPAGVLATATAIAVATITTRLLLVTGEFTCAATPAAVTDRITPAVGVGPGIGGTGTAAAAAAAAIVGMICAAIAAAVAGHRRGRGAGVQDAAHWSVIASAESQTEAKGLAAFRIGLTWRGMEVAPPPLVSTATETVITLATLGSTGTTLMRTADATAVVTAIMSRTLRGAGELMRAMRWSSRRQCNCSGAARRTSLSPRALSPPPLRTARCSCERPPVNAASNARIAFLY